MILTNDEDIAKKVNRGVFPGLQGGPLMHTIAAKAVALGEALRPEFKLYARQVVENAKVLADTWPGTASTSCPAAPTATLMLVDLRPKAVTGKAAAASLHRALLTCNYNGVPFDPQPPMVTSGIRLGTPASTTRGFGTAEFQRVGELIAEVVDALGSHGEDNSAAEAEVRGKVLDLTARFPIYG